MRSRDGDDANDGDVDGLLVPLAPTPLDCPTAWMKKLRRRQPRLGRRVLLALFVFIILGAFVGHKADSETLREQAARLREYTQSYRESFAGVPNTLRPAPDSPPRFKPIYGHGVPDPRFHLLIPSGNNSAELCKTLMSAAILRYPSPTLILYDIEDDQKQQEADVLRQILTFLRGPEVYEDDLILIVEEDSWFQLPAEITIGRYFHIMQDAIATSLYKYGPAKTKNISEIDIPDIKPVPKFSPRVLFGALKQCTNAPEMPACYSVPEPPLPRDVYGPTTDTEPSGRFNRPRFMSSSMVLGHASHMRPIYERAAELLSSSNDAQSSQQAFTQIFGEQEFQRHIYFEQHVQRSSSKWSSWLSSKMGLITPDPLVDPALARRNMTTVEGRNYEFGIALDYRSSIFQSLDNSAGDMDITAFNSNTLVPSPMGHSMSSFRAEIHLPVDIMNFTSPPFSLHYNISGKSDTLTSILDKLPETGNNWTVVNLTANTVVPGGSIPATLNFYGSEELLLSWWPKMWYHSNARFLMRQYLRSTETPLLVELSDGKNKTLKQWDTRGGHGGAWNSIGQWLEFDEICAECHEQLFGDGFGVFWHEGEGAGVHVAQADEPLYNRTSGEQLHGDARQRVVMMQERAKQRKAQKERDKMVQWEDWLEQLEFGEEDRRDWEEEHPRGREDGIKEELKRASLMAELRRTRWRKQGVLVTDEVERG